MLRTSFSPLPSCVSVEPSLVAPNASFRHGELTATSAVPALPTIDENSSQDPHWPIAVPVSMTGQNASSSFSRLL